MADNQNVESLRYSAVNTMKQCPLSCWLIYGKKLKGYQNLFARFGSVIHNILEDYGKHCIANKLETDYSELDKIKLKYLPFLHESQQSDANQVVETIKSNINWSSVLGHEIIEIEKRFQLDSNFNPTENDGLFSSGLDLVCISGDEAYVSDWKTVRAIYTKKYMEESLQRKIYSWMVLKHYPQVNTVYFAFNFVRYGYQGQWMPILREELEELEGQILQEIQALQTLLSSEAEPEATPSAYCQLCPIAGLCREYANAFKECERIENEKDALELYQQFQLAKIRTKRMEELLKFYVSNNTPIRLQYETWGPQEHTKVEYPDSKKLIQTLFKECEIPEGAIYDLIKLSKTDVEKLSRKFKLSPEQKEKIKKLSIENSYIKYETKKIEEEQLEDDEYIDPYI